MKTEIQMYHDFPASNFIKSGNTSDIYIVAEYYIPITIEKISAFH